MKKLILFLLFFPCSLLAQTNSARMLSGVNAQTGTTYTFVAQDVTRLVTFNNALTVGASLPSPLNFGFGAGSLFVARDLGAGAVVITCISCTIDGQPFYTLSAGASVEFYSDGTNYESAPGGASSSGTGAFPNPSMFQNLQVAQTGSFGSNGQAAVLFTDDPYGLCEYTGGTNNVFNELSSVQGVLFWNPAGSGFQCQSVLTAQPFPQGTTPAAGLGYNYNSGGTLQLGAAASYPNGITSPSIVGTGSGTNTFANLTISNLVQGEPVTAGSALGTFSTAAYLFADQFAGADFCAKVNAAIAALPSTGGVIDARGFTVAQPCNSNMYHGQAKNLHVYMPAVPVVTSVPQWTPSNANILEGAADGDSSSTLGSILQECGPTAIGWNGSACIVNGVSVPQFPNSTTQLTFHNVPHGPYPAGTYSCLICAGGQGSSEGLGWQNNSFGQIIQHIKLDGGGNTNTFAIYTENWQERGFVDDLNCGNFGGSSTTAGVACGFWDRTEAPSTQSGPSHFKIGNVHVNFNNTATSTSSWGFVVELNSAICQLSGGGGSGATCYVQKVNSSGTPQVAVGYPGTGYTSAPTWIVYGAPATYNGTQISDCSGTTTLTSTTVTGMGSQCSATDYQVGQFAQGPESFHGTVQGNGANNITGGLYLASENPGIDYLHCERMGNCIQMGSGYDLSSGGHIKNVDTTSTLTGNLVKIEPGNDCQTNFWSLQFTSVGGSPNAMNDDCLISGATGANISIPVSNVPLFGSVRSLEFYSGGGVLNFFDTLKFGPGLGAITHIQGPTDQALTFSAASATGSNQVGQDSVLASGLGSGNGTAAHTKLKGASQAFGSSSTAQTQVTEWVMHKKVGSTTSATPTNMFNVALASGQTAGFEIVVNVSAFQGTPHECSTTETFIAAIQDTSGTVTQQTTAGTLATICDTGTLTLAAGFSTAAPSVFSVTPSWTTIVPGGVIITVEIHNLSQQEISLL
jgi:hypothetical protein